VLPKMQEGVNGLLGRLPFAKTMIAALLGIDVQGELSARLMQSILWVHPVVLALIWGHEIIICTRMPAGEIDRGTVDLLLGLPVTRMKVYSAETLVWLVTGILMLAIGSCGYWLMSWNLAIDARPAPRAVAYVLVNLYCLYLAVGGAALFISALQDRRGQAIAIIFSLVLVSFLVNFLAPLWEPAKKIAFLSVMHYYQPAEIIKTVVFPRRDIMILCICGAVMWLAGALVLQRRDICTV